MSETTLWTNPNPTSSFASQPITLSQDVNNFDYIKISYRGGISNDNSMSIIVSIADYNKADSASTNKVGIAIAGTNSGDLRTRVMFTNGNTSIYPGDARTPTGSIDNNKAIPIKISGLK